MVSTASRVGTGNIVGVATALCLGGVGSMFWMWIIAIIGSASAFVESTLAQIYKKKGPDGCYGGPAYYIETALPPPLWKARWRRSIRKRAPMAVMAVRPTISRRLCGAVRWPSSFLCA